MDGLQTSLESGFDKTYDDFLKTLSLKYFIQMLNYD